MNNEYKYIFSLKMAGWLMLNGFRIIRINHNLQKQNKDVYVFINSKELESCMETYSSFNIKNSKEKLYGINIASDG